MKRCYRIDIHNHIVPKFYVEELRNMGIVTSFGLPFPEWSVDQHLEVMDRNRIAAAVTSITTPGVYFTGAEQSRSLARRCNEYSARNVADHPTRFGGFASLPLPDVDGALEETAYAFDTLGLDGIVLMSNVKGVYPGDARYRAIFEELNRRSAVVYIHPNDPPGKRIPKAVRFYLDTALETTRSVMSLLYGGIFESYPDVRFILSHTGGITPALAHRIAVGRHQKDAPEGRDRGSPTTFVAPEAVQQDLELIARLYVDTITPSEGIAYRTAQKLVGIDHMLLGTDYALMPRHLVPRVIGKVTRRFPDEALRKIERSNALALFPRMEAV
jgi:predicted TIM-barrel fold metal-dependent hydrolase